MESTTGESLKLVLDNSVNFGYDTVKLRQSKAKGTVNVIDPRETKLMSLSEVAKQFGVTVETVYSWTFKGCPSRNKNGNPMFCLKDVIAWKRLVTK